MSANTTKDPFVAVREACNSAPNFDMDNAEIIDNLKQWQSLCSFEIKSAEGDQIEIEFTTLPKDMDAFVRDAYDFCPDLVNDENYRLEILKRQIEQKKAISLWWD
jgi:hypothetical protein